MDYIIRGGLLRLQAGVHRRVSALSKKFVSRIGPHRKKWASAGFFGMALVLGVWAHSSSQAEAVLNWERTHLPSDGMVQLALKSRGFRLLEEGKPLQKVLRSLPVSLDQKGSFWATSDLNWVAYYADPEQVTQTQIFCWECATPPTPWQPSGLGWRGLETLLKDIAIKFTSHRPAVKATARGSHLWRDPREVVY